MPAQRMTLDGHAAVGEPAGGGEQPGGVGAASLGLEPAPVERQRGEVEDRQPFLGQPLQLRALLALDLVVGQRNEVEADVAEEKLVVTLRDRDLPVGERRSAERNGDDRVCGPVLPDQRIFSHRHSSSTEPIAKRLCAVRITAGYQTKPEPNTFWIDSTICPCEITWTRSEEHTS